LPKRYFLGAVGLVNSLRLVGHTEPIRMLDCGLTAEQRALLEPEVELIAAPDRTPPWLLKTVAPLARPAPVEVLLDADILVTRSLAPLIETAGTGRVVAFANPIDRWCEDWGELLDLGEVRRGPYLGSGAIALADDLAQLVLGAMDERRDVVEFERTHWRANEPGYAFAYADQDIFNAVLGARLEPAAIEALPSALAPTPPFAGVRVVDLTTLRCCDDAGIEPYLVHHHVNKPWLERTHHGVYSRLLRRLLLGDDVAVRVPERLLPRRFRRGSLARAEREAINAKEWLRWHLAEPLGARARGLRR